MSTVTGDKHEHISFMAKAIDLSIESAQTGRGGPFGAIIVCDHQVIASGTNLVTSTNDPTAHAEVVAIREACRVLNTFQLRDCDVYSSCEPCPMCLAALYWARPQKIFFAGTREDAAQAGFDDSYVYKELVLPISQRAIPMSQLMREAALAAFRSWAEKPDKQQY